MASFNDSEAGNRPVGCNLGIEAGKGRGGTVWRWAACALANRGKTEAEPLRIAADRHIPTYREGWSQAITSPPKQKSRRWLSKTRDWSLRLPCSLIGSDQNYTYMLLH